MNPRISDSNFRCGSVLLEVVLALALFVGAATIITAGINASIHSVERVRLQNHAVNLAITVLSEMQMRIRPITALGPEPFPPPFQDWTYKIDVAQDDGAPETSESLRAVEVVIRHSQENVVERLSQLFNAGNISTAGTNAPVEPLATGAP